MTISRRLLTCCLAVTLVGCSPTGDDPLEDAQAAFAAQDHAAALADVQAALARDARNGKALELLARIQLAMGQGGAALGTLDRLEETGNVTPGDRALLVAEGHLQTGDAVTALALIDGADSAEAWRLRALAAALQGDDAGARDAYSRGRDAAGERGKLFASEASFHLGRSDLAAASEAVDLARAVAPERVETLFVAARLAEAEADPLLALSHYLRILEIAPMDRPALLGAIAASERAGKGDITRHLVAYGTQTRPLDREVVYQQARVDSRDGKWEAVRERLQAHETELADHDSARLLYAEALLHLGQVETARAIAAPILARRGRDPDALRLQSAIDAAS